ncbi:hypothetical protein OIU34_19730 [Pararhizobium sp. BT-229]|uniref:hypothetical protein n=1 Tax=Pararhizobium sp. BT-229 TaxID=2986923 RepID=UPI0021F6E438|nr:hypothetical protein [Pararhizobium sp. BT-229]MCV9964116.1 hypothetical protein [Pararhizobium sp. BT-229]
MPSTKVLFVVPEDVHALGAILCDHGGTLEFEDQFETYDDARAFLAQSTGSVITAEFEDVDDTLDPLFAFTDELDKQQSAYLGVADAFEEQSRGLRVDGTVVYHLFDGQHERVRLTFPWSDGDPDTDERTLRAAGVPEEKIAPIAGKLMTPAPKSGAAPGPSA